MNKTIAFVAHKTLDEKLLVRMNKLFKIAKMQKFSNNERNPIYNNQKYIHHIFTTEAISPFPV